MGENVQLCTGVDDISFDEQRESVFILAHNNGKAAARLVHILRQDPAYRSATVVQYEELWQAAGSAHRWRRTFLKRCDQEAELIL